jgi:formate--tetrahydrofolate ligase
MATTTALKLADYVVTEAGFGADLGAEKFFDIKCRKAGLSPDVTVIVATIKALKMNGGLSKDELQEENLEAVSNGLANLGRHIQNVKKFGVPVVVAVNHFVNDTEAEIDLVKAYCTEYGVKAITAKHWADGSKGTKELATLVAEIADSGASQFAPIYATDCPLWEKIETIATQIYRADEVVADKSVREALRNFEAQGYGDLPVCMAKTQYSFSTDPSLRGAPTGHVMPVREVRLSAGAEFIVVICGNIMTMPGLPRVPSAEAIGLDDDGLIQGLF